MVDSPSAIQGKLVTVRWLTRVTQRGQSAVYLVLGVRPNDRSGTADITLELLDEAGKIRRCSAGWSDFSNYMVSSIWDLYVYEGATHGFLNLVDRR